MVILSMLPHAEFGRNDHRDDALHFIIEKEYEQLDKDHVKLHARRSESRNLEMGKFKEDLIEEIDSFWLNRVTTAQIIIKDKAKELIKGKLSRGVTTLIQKAYLESFQLVKFSNQVFQLH